MSLPGEDPQFLGASHGREEHGLLCGDVGLQVLLPGEVPLSVAALGNAAAQHGALQVGGDDAGVEGRGKNGMEFNYRVLFF